VALPFTPRIRAFLIVLVLAVAAMGAGLMVIGRNQDSSGAAPAPAAPAPATPKQAPTAPKPSPAKPRTTVTPVPGASFAWDFAPDMFRGERLPAQSSWPSPDNTLFLKHLGARGLTYAQWKAKHAVPAPGATTTQRPTTASTRPKAVVAQPGQALPAALQRALAAHRVVVVALYDPDAVIDGMALREAEAGAQLAGMAFVSVDVTKTEVDSLAAHYGTIRDPAVLVLGPRGDLVFRIDGFADRDTVAQAATNAAS
jgi:hypothetical protein